MPARTPGRHLALTAITCVACAGDPDAEGGDEEVEFRTNAPCEKPLAQLEWTEPPPTFAVAGGDSFVLDGQLSWDDNAPFDCVISYARIIRDVEPAIKVIDDVDDDLIGTMSPGDIIQFHAELKVEGDADASNATASNRLVVSVGFETPPNLEANICVVPKREFSVPIIDDNDGHPNGCVDSLEDGAQCVPMPNGVNGWGSGITAGIFPFAGVLEPFHAKFGGRSVREHQVEPPTGDCRFPGLTGMTKPVIPVVDAYLPDQIGIFSPALSALRAFILNGLGCQSTVKQAMEMSCPDGSWIPYETHPIVVGVDRDCQGNLTPNTVAVSRDGVCESHEVPNPDANGDGVADSLAGTNDADRDNVSDAIEDRNGDHVFTNDDTDNDGLPDFVDWDDDGDLITTYDEGIHGGGPTGDLDGDGLPNNVDTDDDGDGIPTAAEDTNHNGLPYDEDDDDDDDGIPNCYDP